MISSSCSIATPCEVELSGADEVYDITAKGLPAGALDRSEAPVVIEAREQGTVVLEGADVWTDWTPAGEPGTFTHRWPYTWGVAPNPYVPYGVVFPEMTTVPAADCTCLRTRAWHIRRRPRLIVPRRPRLPAMAAAITSSFTTSSGPSKGMRPRPSTCARDLK